MKNIFISGILLMAALTTAAQTNCNIKSAYAFYTASMPGMQMADENGNPIPPKPNIERFVYLEYPGITGPQIATVLYNNKPMVATLTAVEGSTVIPGSDIDNNRKHKITAKKGNRLWKLELQPVGDAAMPVQGCRNILIKVKLKGKICTFKLLKETELAAMPKY